MKRILRSIVLAVILVAGLTTVSAQTIDIVAVQKTPALPSTVTNYLDDPFRYFNVQFIANGWGNDGVDVYLSINFTGDNNPFYARTKAGTHPANPIHLNEGVNIKERDELILQLRNGRLQTNVDYKDPLNAQQLPEDNYQLCVDVYLWSDRTNPNATPIASACPSFEICYSGSAPELVSPMAGAQPALNGALVVLPSRKVNFLWTPVISNCTTNTARFKYKLKVVKVLNNQNYRDAIRYNPTVFSAEVRNSTYAVLDTLRDVKVQMERGALYVAQVQAEPIKTSRAGDNFVIANNGNSQPMPFFWDEPEDLMGFSVFADDESEEGDESEGVDGLTQWEGGVEEVSGLETITEEMDDPSFVSFSTKRHYVESDGYYTIPVTDDIEVFYTLAKHDELKGLTHTIALYDYVKGGVENITAQDPLMSEEVEDESTNHILKGWGAKLKQGNLYYLQVASAFTVDYWNFSIADTCFYVNEQLAEHIHDTISREFVEDEALTATDGVYFQWGDDPEAPAFTTPQWKAPVDRSGDDIYDPANYEAPTTVPEVQKAKTFPVSWTPVKNVTNGDKATYEINVYELKPDQTPEEAVEENEALLTRTVTDATQITAGDSKFFKAFSANKTYVMTLSTDVDGESDTNYHFENGNEALPIVFKIVK